MQVIFIKPVMNVATPGEIKNVADGYAVNYLLPHKFALPATAKNISKYQSLQKTGETVVKKQIFDKKQLAAHLKGHTVSLLGKVDESGTLFAGINKNTIAQALQDAGYTIKPKQVDLSEPIKKTGEYSVGVNIDSGLKVTIQVLIKAEK